MAAEQIEWKNESVLSFAGGQDPVEKMESVSRASVLDAVEKGWIGPPFDPVELARLRGIRVIPNASVADARVFFESGSFKIEYNPNRPTGRVNFSIAHEIAHTLFDDCAENVRHRSRSSSDPKNWQLEMLCNIGAAEILMPVGHFEEFQNGEVSIETLMKLRKKHGVSAEAILIRFVKLASTRVACFSASRCRSPAGLVHRIDYCIGSSSWPIGRIDGYEVKASRVLEECVAIGTTARCVERWTEELQDLHIEAVALPPYPGTSELRVVGFIRPADEAAEIHRLKYRLGNAAEFVAPSNSAVIHIVNDRAKRWGGYGFAGALRRKYPEVHSAYSDWANLDHDTLKLGSVHISELPLKRYVVSLVAQSGYGPSRKPRLRYNALEKALRTTAQSLEEKGVSSIQMPRIGTGQAGGNWEIIVGIIHENLVSDGFEVSVFDLP